MSDQTNSHYKLAHVLLFADIAVLACFLFLPELVLTVLLKIFDVLTIQFDWSKYRFLIWGFVLFSVCAFCSYFRQYFFATKPSQSKGIVIFEVMVLSAVALMTWKGVAYTPTVNPDWITKLGFWSYLFEITTTAGAGYVLADFLFRFKFFFKG
jgi:hypothetical protein